MIDMHIHIVNPQLPGVKTLPDFLAGPVQEKAKLLQEEMQQSGARKLCGMGHLGGIDDDPLGVQSTLQVSEYLPELYAIGVADPTRTDTDHLQKVDRQLANRRIVALKGYLGYLHHGPDSPGYVPYYELAARHGVPMIFHTGDTYSTAAKVKYAHPLLVDEVAVDHRGVCFVMAHFGNPWLLDAAEVVYKNENVWADLSAILIGDAETFAYFRTSGLLQRVKDRVRHALELCERVDRFLFGSDWPLSPIRTYTDFVRELCDEQYHQAIFEDNTRSLFSRLST